MFSVSLSLFSKQNLFITTDLKKKKNLTARTSVLFLVQWGKFQTGITTITNTLSTFRAFGSYLNQADMDAFCLLTYL